jgi:hypothetical protein
MKYFIFWIIILNIGFNLQLAQARPAKATEVDVAPEIVAGEKFLTKCFKDYMGQLSHPNEKVKKRCLSIPFRAEWKALAEKKQADPLLLSEEPEKSWRKNIEVTDLNLKKGTAKVVLGTDDEEHCLKIKLSKNGDDFKIAGTRKCAK